MLHMLCKYYTCNAAATDENGKTPLHIACASCTECSDGYTLSHSLTVSLTWIDQPKLMNILENENMHRFIFGENEYVFFF